MNYYGKRLKELGLLLGVVEKAAFWFVLLDTRKFSQDHGLGRFLEVGADSVSDLECNRLLGVHSDDEAS
jgi:hypothetical protein